MVSTRGHPKQFPDPETAVAMAQESSPRKRATRTSTANHASPTKAASPPQTPTRTRSSTATSSAVKSAWSHTPSNLTLLWLAVSLPLVVWDFTYMLLRPYSMPGGALHKPLWIPYELYGRVDHNYGFKAWNAGEGWGAAQSVVNVLETVAYAVYLYIVYTYGEQEPKQGRGAPDKDMMGQLRALSESRTVSGRMAAWAVMLAYTSAQVTFWKTVLYGLIEVFSRKSFDTSGLETLANDQPKAARALRTTIGLA